jgi:short-subunit dehydrogenase
VDLATADGVFSTLHLAKLMVKDMIARGTGRILITSCIAALMPAPFEAVYGAMKAFDLSFAESLREEPKDTGVTVTALLPGPTDTDFFVAQVCRTPKPRRRAATTTPPKSRARLTTL